MLTFWRKKSSSAATNRQENTHRSNRVGAFLFIADRVPVLAYRISISFQFQFQFKFVAKRIRRGKHRFSITTSFWPSFIFFLAFFANGMVNCYVLQLSMVCCCG